MKIKLLSHSLFIKVTIAIFFIGLQHKANAQDSTALKNQIDLKDVAHKLLKKKGKSNKETKKVQLSVYVAPGYSSATGLAGLFGGNAVFTLKGASKESSINTSFAYTQFGQTILPFQASVWSKNDRFNFISDNRYINYPSSLFGLAGKSKDDSGYTINFSGLKLHESVLAKVANNFYAGLGLYYDYDWDIEEKGLASNRKTALQHYVLDSIPPRKETLFGPIFKLLYDCRDNPVNANKGIYASIVFHPSFKNWGSDVNCSSLLIDTRKYISLSKSHKNILALWGYYWNTFGNNNTPFLMLPSTGWDDQYNTGRGFQQGRYRGKTMLYFESELRFQITNNGLLGGVVFANIQDFPKEAYTSYSLYRDRKFAEVTAKGFGLGLRLKLNKYSKTNIAIDFGFGQANYGTNSFKPNIAVNLAEVF